MNSGLKKDWLLLLLNLGGLATMLWTGHYRPGHYTVRGHVEKARKGQEITLDVPALAKLPAKCGCTYDLSLPQVNHPANPIPPT